MHLLQYLIGDLNYGGKLINQEDKDILNETVKHFINEDVVKKSGLAAPSSQQRSWQKTLAKDLYDLAVCKLDTDTFVQHFTKDA